MTTKNSKVIQNGSELYSFGSSSVQDLKILEIFGVARVIAHNCLTAAVNEPERFAPENAISMKDVKFIREEFYFGICADENLACFALPVRELCYLYHWSKQDQERYDKATA